MKRGTEEHKARERERGRIYREANQEQINERNRLRRHNPELFRHPKRTPEEHKRARIEAGRRYYAKHRDKIAARHKSDRASNPEKYRERAKRDYYDNIERVRNNTLMRRYGISQEDYDALLASQDNVCAICGADPSATRYGVLHVDHDHTTGAIRGLLCDPCNNGLGRFRDDATLVSKALEYLKKQSE